MKQKVFSISLICSAILWTISVGSAQEVGANFNHEPEIIDFKYLKKTPVEWIRTTPYIFEYITGKKDAATSQGLQNVIDAKKMGYKVAFGFRWDFKQYKWNIPEPGSAKEKECFDAARKILERVGASIDIFTLGNEPNLETIDADMKPNSDGVIPLVRFTERLLMVVVDPFYKARPKLTLPDVYVGSIHAPFGKEQQKIPAVVGLMKLAETNPRITGLSIHLHIESLGEIAEGFRFARSIVKTKPIIVPEFSLNRMYKLHMPDILGDSPEGVAFAKKYNRDPNMKLYEWYSVANSKLMDAEEWQAMFATRKWFPADALMIYYKAFKENGVVLATYGYISQFADANLNSNSHGWFINPIFPRKTLKPQPDGDWTPNPLWIKDFTEIVNEGKRYAKKRTSQNIR